MDNQPHILLVDDDENLLTALQISLREQGRITTALSVTAGLGRLRSENIDLVIVDLEFDGQEHDGLYFLKQISRVHPNLPVIVFSGDSNTKRIVEAARHHLVEFVTKGEGDEIHLLNAISKGLSLRKMSVEQSLRAITFETQSPRMLEILSNLDRLLRCPSHAPILITGESGTGKEVLAKHIAGHLQKRIVVTNMAAVPANTAESELFGHKRGAFTTAIADKRGLIEEANGGLCFLDEVGECPLEIQAKLLRVIQDGEFTPVGDTRSRKVDVRFITATNRNLNECVQEGTFRLDLLHRINTFTVHLLPLRERPEDITFYATKFLSDCSPKMQYFLSQGAVQVLKTYDWPGNVRELRNVIERLLVLSTSRTIHAEDVQKAIGAEARPELKALATGQFTFDDILETLNRTEGNRERAAKLLGVHRATLFRWLKSNALSGAAVGKVGRPALIRVPKAGGQ